MALASLLSCDSIISRSPFTSSSMEVSNRLLMSSRLCTSGQVFPVSQLETVWRDTKIACARSSWDMSAAVRCFRMRFPSSIGFLSGRYVCRPLACEGTAILTRLQPKGFGIAAEEGLLRCRMSLTAGMTWCFLRPHAGLKLPNRIRVHARRSTRQASPCTWVVRAPAWLPLP